MWMIIGGLGQLGSALATELTSADIPHCLVDRPDIDITDREWTQRVVEEIHPTVIVNTAAWTAVDAAEDYEQEASLVNFAGAQNVALAAQLLDVTLVHISTDYVFDGTSSEPYREDQDAHPRSAYGRTKLAGDRAAIDAHPHGTRIVRTAWLYSEFGHNFVKTMVRQALAGNTVRVVNDQVGQPTYARDLARHIIDLVERAAPPGTYHGTNSGRTTWYDLTKLIYAELGCASNLVVPVPTTEYPTKAIRPAFSVLDHGNTRIAGLAEMREWQDAVKEALPRVRQAVEQEANQ